MSFGYGVTPFGTALNGDGPILTQTSTVPPVFSKGCRAGVLRTERDFGLRVIDEEVPIASVTALNGLVIASVAVANPNNPAIVGQCLVMAMFGATTILNNGTPVSRPAEAFVEVIMTSDPEIEFVVGQGILPDGKPAGTLYCSVPAKYGTPLPKGNVASMSYGHTVVNPNYTPLEYDILGKVEGVSAPAGKSQPKA